MLIGWSKIGVIPGCVVNNETWLRTNGNIIATVLVLSIWEASFSDSSSGFSLKNAKATSFNSTCFQIVFMRGWEKIRKGAIKNEKHKIKRITARRRKSRESAKRKKTIHVFPILNWNRWRGYCCPQSENIFRRRRDGKIMPNGKRTRLKKPHYNLIKI